MGSSRTQRDSGDRGVTGVSRSTVEAMDLGIGYSGEKVVSDITFSMEQGEAMALIGTNGSGKSTLLKTIVGLLPAIEGELNVFGTRPGNNQKRIAYLGQSHRSGFVLPLRAVDVVRMGRYPFRGLLKPMRRQDDEVVMEAMRTMGIEKLADVPLRSMSGGQQQRTYLAQVLAHQADLLVLDEPTAGLDAGGRELYLHAVNNELRRGASLLVATHDIREEAAMCRQVMLLARKVIGLGPPQEVLTPEALLEAFGIVVAGERHLHVLESRHEDEDSDNVRADRARR